MNLVRKLMIICFAAAVSVACGDDYESLEKDRTAIQTYLTGTLGDEGTYEVADNVYKYVQNADREGYAGAAVVAKGDVVELYYEAYAFATSLRLDAGNYNPTLIFATNRPETLDYVCDPEQMGTLSLPAWERTLWDDEPTVVTVGSTMLVEGVARGLPGSREGDRVWMLFASDLGFGEKELGTVARNQILAYRLYIDKVTKR